ncbi:hypothetical protein ACFQX6_11560 [Streptosporangium lutulentum]
MDVAAGSVDWSPAGVSVVAHPDDCESHLPTPVESLRDRGGPDHVRLRVVDGDTELWNMIVVRPRASAPQDPGDGSGVELREVRYRGARAAPGTRADPQRPVRGGRRHLPRLAVRGDPFLGDRQRPGGLGLADLRPAAPHHPGAPRQRRGQLPGRGLPPRGWGAEDRQRGGRRWYRYASEWRLTDGGTIKPRFGFAGVRNPRTCMRHRHHVYWRFDFDVEGSANDVIEQFNDTGSAASEAVPIVQEVARKRRAPARFWQVTDKTSGRGYRIRPGEHDNTTDPYGVADLWFLRHRPSELYDGNVGDNNQAMLNRFVNGESVSGTNVVVWYAGHFRHDQNEPDTHQGHIVGPDLIPVP